MTNTLDVIKPHYIHRISHHINQTHLVTKLLAKEILYYDDIEGWHPNENDEYPEIYQWLIFPNFHSSDFDQLIKAGIPVLDSDYETWVGITSFGSHYDLYVYPELIEALFGVECSYRDIERYKRR